MIESARDYKDPKNQSVLTDELLDKIVAAYRATPQELADNDFDLNIPRYVDTFEEAAEIDLKVVKKEITKLEAELTAVRAKMDGHLKELGV